MKIAILLVQLFQKYIFTLIHGSKEATERKGPSG